MPQVSIISSTSLFAGNADKEAYVMQKGSKKPKFKIFLSHAGESKKSTVSCFHLLAEYVNGIKTFLDDHSLRKGGDNKKQMQEALEGAPVGECEVAEA